MKFIIFFLLLTSLNIKAQTLLNFNKRFVESEDKWVAFQMYEDSSFSFGFIYIDSYAGLTLHYEGKFRILPNGIFVPKKLDSTNMLIRLQPNKVLVAFIPEDRFQELQISAVPDWLELYKTDTASIERLYRWGFMYNGWDQCAKALAYLEKVYKINPAYKGLSVKLAFSYNCLNESEKAISILESVLRANSSDAYANKEFIYSLIQSGQIEKATETCRRAIESCKEKINNGENCFNILNQYYLRKDKNNFNLWFKETKRWYKGNENLKKRIKIMKKELGV